MTGSSDKPRKLSRRERRQMELIGNAMDQAYGAYDVAKAQDPRIEEALDAVDDATDTLMFFLTLNMAAAVEGLHSLGPYRLEWVMAGRRNLVRLTGEHYDESEKEAEARVKEVEAGFSEKLGRTLIVWMAAIGSTARDDVTSMFVQMIVALGLPDPTEAAAALDEVSADEDSTADVSISAVDDLEDPPTLPLGGTASEAFLVAHLERLASLYEEGLITEDEYRLSKEKIINP